MNETEPGAILAISSHVVRGAVGNRAAVLALEALGHAVWALPTVVMPWHPGHGRSTRIALPDEAFTSACADLAASPKGQELAGALTGYFASPAQVEAAARLIAALKAANPDLIYLCDPVIGDAGGLYVPETVAAAIRDHLLPLADIATPNRFELAWLSGRSPASNADLAEAAGLIAAPLVVVTSAFALKEGATGSLLVGADGLVLAEHKAFETAPNGLGDLFSALYLARRVGGATPVQALEQASRSVFEILARTVRDGLDELAIAREASSLLRPMAMVEMRSLLAPGRPRRVKPSGL